MKNQLRTIFIFVLFISYSLSYDQSRPSENKFNEEINRHAFLVDEGHSDESLTLQTEEFEGLEKINGTEIFCKVIGKGDPLVIVHGGPGLAHDYLYEPFKQLAYNYKLIFYDQRGC